MRFARVVLLSLALALCLSLASAQFEHRCPTGSRVVAKTDPCTDTVTPVANWGKKCCKCPRGQYTTSQTATTCTSCGASEHGVDINLESGTHQCGCIPGWGGWTHSAKACTECVGSTYRDNIEGAALSTFKGTCQACLAPKIVVLRDGARVACEDRACGDNEFRMADGITCAECDEYTTSGVSGGQCACKAGHGGFTLVQDGNKWVGKCQQCALNQWSVGGAGAICGQCHYQHTEGTKDLADGKRSMCSCKPGTGNAVYNNGQTAQCQPCPEGEFSVGGFLARCLKCSDMEGAMSPGAQSNTQCQCKDGHGDFALAGPAHVLNRPSAYLYADADRVLTQSIQFKCAQCQPGKVSQQTGEKPLGTCGNCPIGFSTYLPGQSECVTANENCKTNPGDGIERAEGGLHYYFDLDAEVCKACPAGRWNGARALADQAPTPTFQPVSFLRRRLLESVPAPCRYSANEGHVDAQNEEITTPVQGYTTDGQGSSAYQCQKPSIQENTNSLYPSCSKDACKQDGKFQDTDGQVECQECNWSAEAGTARTFSSADFTHCVQCEAGQHADSLLRKCVTCPEDTYSTEINQNACTPCDSDYATTFGAVGQRKCQCKETYSRRFEQFKADVLGNVQVKDDFSGALCRPHNCQPGQYYGKSATTGSLNVKHGSCLPCEADHFCNSEVGCKQCTKCADHASTFGMEGQSECRCKNKAGMLPGWTSETAQDAFGNDQIRSIGLGDAAPNAQSLDVDTISSGALCTPACKPGQWWDIDDPSLECQACPANFYCPVWMTFGCSGADGKSACLPCNGDVAESAAGSTRCTCKQHIVLPQVDGAANVNTVTEFVDLDGSADGSGCLPVQWARR